MAAPKKADGFKKEIVVKLATVSHPGGKRQRAGFLFTKTPIKVSVTQEEYDAIAADPYLRISNSHGDLKAAQEQVAQVEEAGTIPDKPDSKADKASREELVKKLEEAGLKEGKDFTKEASLDDLAALLAE